MAEYYTIKDMASEFKCTYEAVRQQTSRYSKELSGHSHLDGKTRYYDDWAVESLWGTFPDACVATSTVIQ